MNGFFELEMMAYEQQREIERMLRRRAMLAEASRERRRGPLGRWIARFHIPRPLRRRRVAAASRPV